MARTIAGLACPQNIAMSEALKSTYEKPSTSVKPA
jgi:hypothetical protein